MGLFYLYLRTSIETQWRHSFNRKCEIIKKCINKKKEVKTNGKVSLLKRTLATIQQLNLAI
jgi:hypothetical protein